MYKVDRNSRKGRQSVSPQSSLSKVTVKHPLSQFISEMSRDQVNTFSQLAQKCSILQNSLTLIEEHLSSMSQRVSGLNQGRETQMLGSLKMKQYEFMIGQLKNTVSKQNKKEERLLEELEGEKRKVEKYREEVFKLEARSTSFSEKIASLQAKVADKNKEIAALSLSLRVSKTQGEKEREGRGYALGGQGSQEYVQLQQKLQQLQRQFNAEMQKMMSKNSSLSAQLRKKQEQCQQLKVNYKLCKKQLQQLRIGKYELQIKLKQQVNLYNELQQTNNKLIEKTNSNEILLHKQIQQYKTKENEYKNEYKREKKNFRLVLSAIAQMVNGNNKYYLTAHSIKEQVQEIRKLHEKNIKKKVENYMREAEFYQGECNKLRVRMEEREVHSQEVESREINSRLVKYDSMRERQFEGEAGERNSQGSFVGSRSIDRTEQQKHRGVQQKYMAKLQGLRREIKLKQSKINQLQRMQQTQFDHSKQKILQLQLSISQKVNEIRKYELKVKQKQYEIGELRNSLREMQGKVMVLGEKMQNEREASGRLLQSKVQLYEQKLKALKASFKELQRKEQEKTIKYNKLKSKSEKYEVEVSQSLKRKNAQIDQLLKENNRIKIEVKLLEEKVNVNHIIQEEVANKGNGVSGQKVVEQLRIERDRINGELLDRMRQCEELTQLNLKLSNDQIVVKKELVELKLRIQEMIRNEQILQQENRFAKQKIEQLSKVSSSQNEERHSYLKKQLQRQVVTVKKMEQSLSKQGEEKQQLRRQLEQAHNEVHGLRSGFQKLKEKNTKMSNELLDLKESQKKSSVDYERRLSEYATKEEQLISIINYKNRESQHLRSSMVGEEAQEEEQRMVVFNQETNTDAKETKEVEVNTDPVVFGTNQSVVKELEQQIIPSELIYDEIDEGVEEVREKQRALVSHREQPEKVVNYFSDLIMNTENMDEHFQICEQGQEINIGQTAVNLQIKEVFNVLRREIEKVLNEEDVSISSLRVLPKQLQDDFNEFLVYVKEKVVEIKSENNLSFIMVQAGNEPQVQDIEVELQEFMRKDTTEYVMRLRKIIEEKESLISSLMNEKTEQENTINQLTVEKEEVEEENENRFMNQCNVYKREIKEHKKLIDLLQMSCQSLKNIFKNMLQIWVEEGDNEDDLRDNLVLYGNICKLTDTEKKRIGVYLQLYREFKKIR